MSLDIYFGTKIGQRQDDSERKILYNLLKINPRVNKIFPEHINRDNIGEFEEMKKKGFNFYEYDLLPAINGCPSDNFFASQKSGVSI